MRTQIVLVMEIVDVFLQLSSSFSLLGALVVLLVSSSSSSSQEDRKKPPGPGPFPLLGNLLLFDLRRPYYTLMKVSWSLMFCCRIVCCCLLSRLQWWSNGLCLPFKRIFANISSCGSNTVVSPKRTFVFWGTSVGHYATYKRHVTYVHCR